MQFTSNHCCFVSTILVYMYSIPMRSTSRPTQSSDCLVPLDLLLSLHNPTVTSDKENIIVPSGLAQLLGPWLFLFILYLFIQASPNCITTNPTVSVLTACSIAWDEVFRHMDQGNRDAGVGQFLVNIKSNCFPPWESQRTWTEDDGHLMLKGSLENQLRRMSSLFRQRIWVFLKDYNYNIILQEVSVILLHEILWENLLNHLKMQLASSLRHWCLHIEQPQAQHPPTSTHYYESTSPPEVWDLLVSDDSWYHHREAQNHSPEHSLSPFLAGGMIFPPPSRMLDPCQFSSNNWKLISFNSTWLHKKKKKKNFHFFKIFIFLFIFLSFPC